MKPYPKYKDSGVEWIGVVPEGLYNDAQREEWVWLFAIDEIKKDPRGKRGFEMAHGRPKTPYPEQMESGVFCSSGTQGNSTLLGRC